MKRLAFCIALALAASAEAAPWTYRGTLNDGGAPANGRYDIRLSLLDAAGAKSLAYPLTFSGVEVKNGVVAIDVDFGMDLTQFGALKLKTEVAQGGSSFVALGEPQAFDAKSALAGVCWDTQGNAGTNVATDFLGTTDNKPLEIKVNNARVMRYEGNYNVVGGTGVNSVNPSYFGQTIAGGGSSSMICGDGNDSCANQTSDSFASIGGGLGNTASGAAAGVSGGQSNTASGYAAVVSGGQSNTASGDYAGVSGGPSNTASGYAAVVSGGYSNTASGYYAGVSGGTANTASGYYAGVSGGYFNTASGTYAGVSGGYSNTASGGFATVAGGYSSCAGGEYSFAAGRQAKTRPGSSSGAAGVGCDGVSTSGDSNGDEGTFTWADAQSSSFVSTGPNQFLVRADGGVGINTAQLGNQSNLRLAELTIRNGSENANANVDMNLMTANARGYSFAVVPGSGGTAGTFYLQELDATTNGAPSWTSRLIITSSGQTQVQGGAVGTISDARLKKNIGDIEQPLKTLLGLRGHRFEYTDPALALGATGTRIGFVAQEVKNVLPQWVSDSGNGYYSVAPSGFEALTVEAIREQQALITTIQGTNAKLEAELQQSRDQNAQLQEQLQALAARLAALEAAKAP